MPYKADIYFRKGEKAIHDNNLDLALKMYEKAVKYNPKERHYYGELTYTYYKKAAAIPMTNKDKKRMWVEKTFDRIKDAFVVNPNDGYFYNILGATYALAYDIDEQESDKQKAFENYRKALKYNIVFAEPHNNMGALYSKLGEYDKAIEEYKEVLKIIPDDVQCMATLGDLYFKKGNMKEAIMWLKKALEINPELLRAHHRLGEIYFSQGKFASSAMCFKRILEIDPKNIRVYADLGAALLRNGQIEEARAAFEYVVRHDPNNLYIRQVLEALP
jgi:tetratricopeptide (TPR) repeat protein